MIDTEILQDIYTDHDLCGTQRRELVKVIAMIKQNRLIELPCAVGDTVWFVGKQFNHHFINEYAFDIFMFDDIGNRIFLTKEEAERKLEELKGVKE